MFGVELWAGVPLTTTPALFVFSRGFFLPLYPRPAHLYDPPQFG